MVERRRKEIKNNKQKRKLTHKKAISNLFSFFIETNGKDTDAQLKSHFQNIQI